jgi:hypothetical protein
MFAENRAVMSQVDDDTLVQLSVSQSILIENVSINSLSASNFV